MKIDIETYKKPCECGRPHSVSVKEIKLECGALAFLAEAVAIEGWRKPLIVSDSNTFDAAGSKAAALLSTPDEVVLKGGELHADENAVAQLKSALDSSTDTLVAVGAGTVHDVTRYVAAESGIPFIAVPTAASVDGFLSSVAAMTWQGFKRTFPAVAPLYVVADTDVFASAPKRLNASGMSDLMGKYTALNDWKVANLVTGEYFCQTVCDMEYEALERVALNAPAIQHGDKKACEELMFALLLSGLAMQMVGNSRPASGCEHHMSHLWEMAVLNPPLDAYHGEKVSVGLMACAALYREFAERVKAGTVGPSCYDGVERPLLGKYFSGERLKEILAENTPDPLYAVDRERLVEKLPDIAEIILDSVPLETSLVALLDACGCAKTAEDIGLDPAIMDVSLAVSPYVRNRLTLMRLMKLLS